MVSAIPSILLLGLLARAGEACDVPAEYTHRATVVQGNLVVTLALDHDTYLRGQPIDSYLGIENTGTDTVLVCSGSDPMNVFAVMVDSCVSLDSACIDTSLYFYPEVVYFFGECNRILPGECAVRLVSWNGWIETWDPIKNDIVRTLPAPGPYVALAGLYQPSPTGMHFVIPTDGITLPITISESTAVDVQPISWGHLKSLYGR
jgi:hypothetical protein